MKRYFVLLIFLTSGLLLKAQHKPFQFGFKLAGNIGWYVTQTNDYNNNGIKPGFSWGVVADFYLMEHYSLATGFDMVYLNGKLTYPYITSEDPAYIVDTVTATYNTKYIQLPVVFTMKTKNIKGLRFYGQIGAAAGILIKAHEEVKYNGTVINEGKSDMFSLLRGSFIFGTGIEVPFNKSIYLRTGMEFNNGFSNVLKGNSSANSDIENNARSNFLEINLAIIF